MKFKIRRKRKSALLTPEDMHQVVKEELALAETNRKNIDEEESKKIHTRQVIDALPPRKRLKVLRYLKRKGVQDGKE
jgi:hypothetical protein